MSIDEAIKHAEEVAESQEYEGKKLEKSGEKYYYEYENYCASQCFECAEEHRQLAEWLKELKQTRQAIEDIKTEIESKTYGDYMGHNEYEMAVSDGLEKALIIIDKHISGNDNK